MRTRSAPRRAAFACRRALTLGVLDCYHPPHGVSTRSPRVLTSKRTTKRGPPAWRVARTAPARWSPAPRPSCGPSSRNTSPPRSRWAARRWSSSTGLGVSSATVRNVMAELERAGYLTHPHTSAGRVPTDEGYRLYVESIADAVVAGAGRAADDPPPVRAGRVRQRAVVPPRRGDPRRRRPTSAGLATPAKPPSCRLRRVDLVATGDRLASLVLVLAEGAVKQVLVPLDGAHRSGRRSTTSRAGSTSGWPAWRRPR